MIEAMVIFTFGYGAGILTCVLFGIFFLYLVTRDAGKGAAIDNFVGECVDGDS